MNIISARGTAFTDENGRERIFNGVNFCDKNCLPDEDGVIHVQTMITEERISKLASLGVNAIRLGITWAAVEPEPEQYNTTYLDEVADIIKLCEKYGVYVFVDWHQDLFSYYAFHWGDGAPKWACKDVKEKIPTHKFTWAEGYFFGKTVQKSFDAFWNNEDFEGRGIQDRYCDMLSYCVRHFMNKGVSVLGWDVMNEPFPGTVGGKIFRTLVANGIGTIALSKRVNREKLVADALSGRVMDMLSIADDPIVYHGIIDAANQMLYKFDTEKYYPFLKRACEAVRRESPDGIIFAENCYYSNIGIPCSTPRVTYDDGSDEKNLAFTPHGYDLTVDSPLTNEASPYRVDFIFDEHKRTQQRLNAPVLVGEWGGMVPGAEKYPALEHLIEKFDYNKWSTTYWHYLENMEIESKIMDILGRSYPMAVAGTIKSYGCPSAQNCFTLSYTGSADIKAPTLIYLHKEPKKIYSTKKYVLKEKNGARILQVYAGKGECVVKVEF